MADDLLISFYGDDFTGSTASLEAMAQAGARAMLFLDPPTRDQLTRYPKLQAVGVAGMSRSMSPAAMEKGLPNVLRALKSLGAAHVHYKVCSTFDSSPTIGSIGKVIDLAANIFDSPFVPLLVAMPTMGRHCLFGNLFARFGSSGEVFRLDRHPSMKHHPVTPADESDLRLHLGRQTNKSIALFDILQVSLPPAEATKALAALLERKPHIVLFDVLYTDQLLALGRLIEAYASRDRPLFSVGSSDLEMALGANWVAEGKLTPVKQWPSVGKREPVIAVSGSCSPVTAGQIAWAKSNGFEEISLDTAALATDDVTGARAIKEATASVVKSVKSGRSVVIHTQPNGERGRITLPPGKDSAQLFGSALGNILRAAVAQTGLKRVAVAGGDTSGYVARALGIEALEMIRPLSPGVPLCKATAPGSPADGVEISFKGGQAGATNYFGLVAQGSA